MVKNVKEGKLEENFKYLHPDGVIVYKGKSAHYGKDQIGAAMKKLIEEYKPKNIKREKECYGGCDFCICASYEAHFDTAQGLKKVPEYQIWKKHDGHWKLYHMEYDLGA
ncbi:hypothetical protein GCK32_020057 [Trichostrongylus colubriformis]|uniref:DUF4440 domain-containing protein n=1 Tax=Trichostrongylus colubriformis TaxID=6319 RepID=A0AAN8FEY8_TRICO